MRGVRSRHESLAAWMRSAIFLRSRTRRRRRSLQRPETVPDGRRSVQGAGSSTTTRRRFQGRELHPQEERVAEAARAPASQNPSVVGSRLGSEGAGALPKSLPRMSESVVRSSSNIDLTTVGNQPKSCASISVTKKTSERALLGEDPETRSEGLWDGVARGTLDRRGTGEGVPSAISWCRSSCLVTRGWEWRPEKTARPRRGVVQRRCVLRTRFRKGFDVFWRGRRRKGRNGVSRPKEREEEPLGELLLARIFFPVAGILSSLRESGSRGCPGSDPLRILRGGPGGWRSRTGGSRS